MKEEDLIAEISHEFFHHIQYEMAGNKSALHGGVFPWWLEEGLAESVSAPFKTEGRIKLHEANLLRLIRENSLLDWKDISNPEQVTPRDFLIGYDQGWSMVDYITNLFGKEKRNQWLELIASGESINSAYEQIFGVSFKQLDKEWRNYLKE